MAGALDRVHTHAGLHVFALHDLDLWPFDLILIGERGIVIDYLHVKFGNCSLSRCARTASNIFCTLWPCDLDLWHFDPKIMPSVDYTTIISCTKFEIFGIIPFWVIVRTNKQTNTYRITHRRGCSPYSSDYRQLSTNITYTVITMHYS